MKAIPVGLLEQRLCVSEPGSLSYEVIIPSQASSGPPPIVGIKAHSLGKSTKVFRQKVLSSHSSLALQWSLLAIGRSISLGKQVISPSASH